MAKHFTTLTNEVWLPYKFSVGPVFLRFYEELKQMRIFGNRCATCGKTFVPPRSFCPACHEDIKDWIELAQEGEIVTWAMATQEFFGMPTAPPFVGAFRIDAVNQRVALASLAEEIGYEFRSVLQIVV